MPSQRILFTSDLHSRRELYAELVRWTESVRPHLVVLGGDQFGGDPRAQAAFARGPFIDTLQRLRDAKCDLIGTATIVRDTILILSAANSMLEAMTGRPTFAVSDQQSFVPVPLSHLIGGLTGAKTACYHGFRRICLLWRIDSPMMMSQGR